MNVKLFQQLADHLLKAHFGIELNDTGLTEADHVQAVIAAGVRPYQYLNEHAEDCELCRIDKRGFYDVPMAVPLTLEEELTALRAVQAIQLLGEDPANCPVCSSRTDFDEIDRAVELSDSGQQHHKCLNDQCGHEFIAEFDTESSMH